MEAHTATLACLDVVSGPASGQRLPLDEGIRFGCDEPGIGGLCGDRWLSHPHAAIRRGPTGQFEVEDLGSVEGTTLNGSSVRVPRPLHVGDVIELGSSRIVVSELSAPPLVTEAQPARSYTPASDSRRVLAVIADSIIEVGVAYLALHVFSSVVLQHGTNVAYAAVGFLVAAQLTYRFLFESLMGQTLGKRLFGIRVVRVDGRPLDPNAVLIRTLLWPIDAWFLIGMLVMVLSGRKRRRRLGDLAAGTIVVPASSPHPGFARRDRDRLMLATPLLWLVTIAVVLRLLGPGLQGCQDVGVAPPIANEGSCLEAIGGTPVELRIVNAGHKLSLPAFDVTLERTTVQRVSAFRSVVSFKVAVTNRSGVPFGADRAAVELWVPSPDGGTIPVPEDAPPDLGGTPRIVASTATETGWLRFTIPSDALASLTDPTSDLALVSRVDGQTYLGEIRLWRFSGAAGQAAVAGLAQ
jgi:uncharacterized RDD family membrane protein YckC